MNKLNTQPLVGLLFFILLANSNSLLGQNLESVFASQETKLNYGMIGQRTAEWYESIVASAGKINHPCPTPPPELNFSFLAPEDPLPPDYSNAFESYLAGIKNVRLGTTDCRSMLPEDGVPEASGKRRFRAWEGFRKNLESYRQQLEMNRETGQISLEAYRSELPLYYEGIFMYKDAFAKAKPQPTPPPPKPQPTPPPSFAKAKPQPTPPPPKPQPTPPPSFAKAKPQPTPPPPKPQPTPPPPPPPPPSSN